MAPGHTIFSDVQPASVPDIDTSFTDTLGTGAGPCSYEVAYPSALLNNTGKCAPPTFDLTIDTGVEAKAEDIITPRLSRLSLHGFDVDNMLQGIMDGHGLVDTFAFDAVPAPRGQGFATVPEQPAPTPGTSLATSRAIKAEPGTTRPAFAAPGSHAVGQPCKPLPKGHKPARGRGRTKQLKQMTDAQKQAEGAILREKNRIAARDFRARRKNKIQALHDSVDHFRALSKTQAVEITTLKQEVARLRALAGTRG